MALPIRPPYNNPIPNNPFYYPETNYLQGALGPLVVGTGFSIDYLTGTINATGGGGGGGGAITQILAGPGITVNPPAGVGVVTIGLVSTPVTSVTVNAPLINFGSATAPDLAVQTGTTGQKGVLQVGANINLSSGVISVASASTTNAGIVQLNDTVTSTSITEALTANQGKQLQAQISALSAATNITLAGTFNASTSQMLTVTAEGTAQGFAVGANLPAPGAGNIDFFVIITTNGTYSPPGGGGPFALSQGDWLLSNGLAWQFLNVGSDLPVATTGSQGIVQLATPAQTATGTDTTLAVTPAGACATYIPYSALTAKGALITASGANTLSTLTAGANGSLLSANAACAGGLEWITTTAIPDIPCAAFTAKGEVLVGTAASNFVALPVGGDGTILTADATCTAGVKWGTPLKAFTCANNSALGCNAGAAICAGTGVTGTNNTLSGLSAGCSITTGSGNTHIGACAGTAMVSSGNSTLVGFKAGATATALISDTYVGACAGNDASGVENTYVGFLAGGTTGNSSDGGTFIGALAGCKVSSGNNNTFVGVSAGRCLTTGGGNTTLGFEAGCALDTGSLNVVIGADVQAPSPTGDCQLAIGFGAADYWLTGDSSKNIKFYAGIKDCADSVGTAGQVLSSTGTELEWTTPAASTSIPCACLTAKGDLIAASAASTPTALTVGTDSQVLIADAACATGMKWGALRAATPTCAGVALGCTTGSLTAIGCCIGTSGGAANTFIGCGAGKNAGGTTTCNVAVGQGALGNGAGGCCNVAIGANALCSQAGDGANVAIGFGAGQFKTGGYWNVFIGNEAASGGAPAYLIWNTFVGACSGVNAGSYNTMIGTCAGPSAGGLHDGSIFIGANSGVGYISCGCQLVIGNNSGANAGGIACKNVIIGHNIVGGFTNQLVLGNGGQTCAYYNLAFATNWIFTSDARVKDGVTALPVNAEAFINDLRPVSYCFLDRETKQPLVEKHCNVGFIAQEVEAAMEAHGLSHITSLVEKPRDEDDYYGLTDASFTPFVIKAIQELSAKVAALEAKLAANG